MQNDLIFVISPIGEEGTDKHKRFLYIFNELIVPVLRDINENYRIIRADHIAKPGSFVKEILRNLRDAFIVIADLSEQSANVFYELGIRHAISNRTIMITNDIKSLASDLKEYRTIGYKIDNKGNMNLKTLNRFKRRLKKFVKEIIKNPEHPDNPVKDRLPDLFKDKTDVLSINKKSSKAPRAAYERNIEDSADERIHRIFSIQKITSIGYSSPWDGIDHSSRRGNFYPYVLRFTKSAKIFFASINNHEFNLHKDLADVRVLVSDHANDGKIPIHFIISTNDDLSSSKKIIDKFFKKALRLQENSKRKYKMEIWDNNRLTIIEKRLGLK